MKSQCLLINDKLLLVEEVGLLFLCKSDFLISLAYIEHTSRLSLIFTYP